MHISLKTAAAAACTLTTGAMKHYTDIDTVLDRLAAGIEAGVYTKASVTRALTDAGWNEMAAELHGNKTAIKHVHLAPLQRVGLLVADPEQAPCTYAHLARGIAARLELVRFARKHMKNLTAQGR